MKLALLLLLLLPIATDEAEMNNKPFSEEYMLVETCKYEHKHFSDYGDCDENPKLKIKHIPYHLKTRYVER